MHLHDIQESFDTFIRERCWDRFPASLVFAHLVEELGEISRYITVEEGYKAVGLGHEAPDMSGLAREFAQAFSLFLQLASHFGVDLEEAVLEEHQQMTNRFPVEEWREFMERWGRGRT